MEPTKQRGFRKLLNFQTYFQYSSNPTTANNNNQHWHTVTKDCVLKSHQRSSLVYVSICNIHSFNQKLFRHLLFLDFQCASTAHSSFIRTKRRDSNRIYYMIDCCFYDEFPHLYNLIKNSFRCNESPFNTQPDVAALPTINYTIQLIK